MHGSSAREIKRTEFKEPATGIPGPAGDGVVDDGGPNENEDAGGHQTTAFHCAAHDDHGGCTGISWISES